MENNKVDNTSKIYTYMLGGIPLITMLINNFYPEVTDSELKYAGSIVVLLLLLGLLMEGFELKLKPRIIYAAISWSWFFFWIVTFNSYLIGFVFQIVILLSLSFWRMKTTTPKEVEY